MTIRRLLPALVLSTLVLVGCTDQGSESPNPSTEPTQPSPPATAEPSADPTDQPSSPTSEPTAQPSTPAAEPTTPGPSAGTANNEPKQSEGFPSVGDAALLPTTVRVAHHEGYDRVVVEFTGTGTPGYRAQYVDEALHPGSGEPIEVPGSFAMEVIITGTRMPEENESFAKGEYDSGDATDVSGVTFSPPFEGQSLMVIGADDELPFTVQTLTEPSRLVIDIHTD